MSSPVSAPSSPPSSSFGSSGGGSDVEIPCGCIVIPLIIFGISFIGDCRKPTKDDEPHSHEVSRGGEDASRDVPQVARPLIFVARDTVMYESPTLESDGRPVSKGAMFFLRRAVPDANEWFRDGFCYATASNTTSETITLTLDGEVEPADDIHGGWISRDDACVLLHRQMLHFQRSSGQQPVHFYRTRDELSAVYGDGSSIPDTVQLDSVENCLFPVLETLDSHLDLTPGNAYRVNIVDLSGRNEMIPGVFVSEINRAGNNNIDCFALVQRQQLRDYVNCLDQVVATLKSAEDLSSDELALVVERLVAATTAIQFGQPIESSTPNSDIIRWAAWLPVQIDVFSMNANRLRHMADSEYQLWLDRVAECATNLRSVCENDQVWTRLNTSHELFCLIPVEAFP